MNKTWLGFLGLLGLVCTGQAWAALGQSPSPGSVGTPLGRYTRHEAALDTGTVVREYATPDGQVFALAWRGPVLPDLTVWMGRYFEPFKQETEQARSAGHRGGTVRVARDGLVVNSAGRMPHFSGYAYVTNLIPPGLQIKDVLE